MARKSPSYPGEPPDSSEEGLSRSDSQLSGRLIRTIPPLPAPNDHLRPFPHRVSPCPRRNHRTVVRSQPPRFFGLQSFPSESGEGWSEQISRMCFRDGVGRGRMGVWVRDCGCCMWRILMWGPCCRCGGGMVGGDGGDTANGRPGQRTGTLRTETVVSSWPARRASLPAEPWRELSFALAGDGYVWSNCTVVDAARAGSYAVDEDQALLARWADVRTV